MPILASLPLLASGGNAPPIVASIAIAFVAAAAMTLLCERIKLPSIAGFIFAGLLVGPVGLGLISDLHEIETIAGLGLVLLLFLIGLELDLNALLASGRMLIGTGILQVPLSVALAFGVFMGLGAVGFGTTEMYPALYLALACAFSSTLLVVKVLHDRLQVDTVDGRLCVGLLIFQDIWAIVVLALQPNLQAFQIAPLIATFVGVVLIIVVAGLGTRYLLPWAFRLVAKSPELVVTLALGWCFGLGMLAGQLGPWADALGLRVRPDVSMELGALIAGTTIATFPYAHEVVAKVSNLRDFFITLFFVALGMSIPIPEGVGVLLGTLALVTVMFVLRYVVFLPLLYFNGLDRRHATTIATKLAQVSEFALVIAYLGLSLGHIDAVLVSEIIFAFVLTAILTPMLFNIADPLYAKLATPLDWLRIRDDRSVRESEAQQAPRLVFLGFHRLASSLLEDLRREHPDLITDTLVIDFNVGIHDRIRARGPRVIYGDISNPATLEGIAEAHVIICTISDDILKGISNLQLTKQLRKIAPNAKILVNAVRLQDIPRIYDAGANYVFSWRTETAMGVVPAIHAALNDDLGAFIDERRDSCGDPAERDEVLD